MLYRELPSRLRVITWSNPSIFQIAASRYIKTAYEASAASECISDYFLSQFTRITSKSSYILQRVARELLLSLAQSSRWNHLETIFKETNILSLICEQSVYFIYYHLSHILVFL